MEIYLFGCSVLTVANEMGPRPLNFILIVIIIVIGIIFTGWSILINYFVPRFVHANVLTGAKI